MSNNEGETRIIPWVTHRRDDTEFGIVLFVAQLTTDAWAGITSANQVLALLIEALRQESHAKGPNQEPASLFDLVKWFRALQDPEDFDEEERATASERLNRFNVRSRTLDILSLGVVPVLRECVVHMDTGIYDETSLGHVIHVLNDHAPRGAPGGPKGIRPEDVGPREEGRNFVFGDANQNAAVYYRDVHNNVVVRDAKGNLVEKITPEDDRYKKYAEADTFDLGAELDWLESPESQEAG